MKSVMTHNFQQLPEAEIQRSSFDRSHGHKTTFDAGYLIPVYVDEALPGDTFNLKMSALVRLASPLFKPVMDNMYLESHFFAVPYRLVWENWERMNGAQDTTTATTDYHVPQVDAPLVTGVEAGTLADYMGIPIGIPSLRFDSLFLRAYNLIWNTWYRSESIQDSVHVDYDDGPDTYTDYVLLRRGKRSDYFTSCMPWPQKGPDVELPLGSKAYVKGIGKETAVWAGPYNNLYESGETVQTSFAGGTRIDTSGDDTRYYVRKSATTNYPDIYADLSSATASTINEIREAFQLQKLLERDARGGTRYIEILKSHFGVTSPDYRVQRPEFLGGGSTFVNVHPVPATNQAATVNQGDLAAFGTAVASGHGFTKSFTEHCLLLGLVSVRADLTYQQGLNRMWSRRDRYDFYWPALSHLGEQEVLRGEIYADGTANDSIVFGYQERYAEYRYKPSMITGQLRSTYATPLDMWHLSQEFGAAPTLSNAFIVEDPPLDRIVAVPTEPHFILDAFFDLKCARPMPTYSVPGWLDHF